MKTNKINVIENLTVFTFIFVKKLSNSFVFFLNMTLFIIFTYCSFKKLTKLSVFQIFSIYV